MEQTHHTENNYLPLIVVIGMIVAISAITGLQDSLYLFVVHFMSGFFLVFGGFKIMDIRGFVHGYATYDLLASRWRGYAYLYPFIELAFGFAMLAGYHPDWLLISEAGVMIFSGIGVLRAMRKKGAIECACLGTVLKVPLTSVTLIEDFGMASLAILLLLVR